MNDRALDLAELKRRLRETETVLEASRELTSTLEADKIMDVVLETCMQAVQAEAGTLWILENDAYLLPLAARGPNADRLKDLRLKKGEGLAGQACERGEPVFVEDVTKDERWARRFDKTTGFVTRSLLVVPLIAGAKAIGSLQMINKLGGALFDETDLRICTALATQSARVILNSRVYTQQRRFLDSLLRMVAALLDARDPFSRGHSERVGQHALLIARGLGLEPEEQELVEQAGLLHDIGKASLPEELLLNAHPLDVKAWEQINTHPSLGGNVLFQLEPKTMVRQLWAGARYHHERFDGNGYPVGLAGEDIPLVARIVAVANAFDNLVSSRRYGSAKNVEEALGEIESCAGSCYDPKVVKVFIELMRSRRTAETREPEPVNG